MPDTEIREGVRNITQHGCVLASFLFAGHVQTSSGSSSHIRGTRRTKQGNLITERSANLDVTDNQILEFRFLFGVTGVAG